MAKDQEHTNRSVAQKLRRLREAREGDQAVQDQVIDVVIEHSQQLGEHDQQISDIDRRLAEVERIRAY